MLNVVKHLLRLAYSLNLLQKILHDVQDDKGNKKSLLK